MPPSRRWPVSRHSPLTGSCHRVAQWTPDAVRITAGDGMGVTGHLVGLAGLVRRPGGSYLPSGYVVTPATADTAARRRLVSLADLERLG